MNYCKESQTMYGSSPLYSSQASKINCQSENEIASKTTTKFPPIKTKTDDTPSIKENIKESSPPNQLFKKVSEEPNGITQQLRKANNTQIKKKADKKKNKFPEIKPEITEKYKQFNQFLWLVGLSNNIRVITNERLPNFILYVGKGNNSSLIKNLFRTYRPWWTIEQNNSDNPAINLYWYQLRQNQILDNFKENMKAEPEFQGCQYYAEDNQEKEETNAPEKDRREANRSGHKKGNQARSHSVTQKQIKSALRLGIQKRSSSKSKGISQEKTMLANAGLTSLKKNVHEQLQAQDDGKKKRVLANPKMWPIYTNYRRIFCHSQLKQLKKLKIISEDGRISSTLSRNKLKLIENRSNYIKMHNHVTYNWNLSNKKALFMNLKHYYQAQKINPFEYIPMTFHVTDLDDKEFKRFQEQYERRAEAIKEEEKKKKNQQFKYGFKPKKRNAWLLKPGQNTNRGTGIEVVESIQEMREKIGRERVDKMGRPRTHILQQYIMPFLYQKRKFDIRTYILLTSINGYQKGYWYQDGYLRTASKQFTMKNLNNRFIHLTNDAVQKYHEDYGKFQAANKLSYADFQRHLDTVYNNGVQNGQKLKFYSQAYPQMKKIAGDMFRSVYSKINANKKDFTFEVFGLDYMIDENFKVWLIEANTNPCLELCCPLLGRLIPTMLENALKIAVDPIFPPPPVQQLVSMAKKLMLPDSLLQTNKFEIIFDQTQQCRQLKLLLSSTPEVKIFEVQEEDEEYDQNGNQCAKIEGEVGDM